MARWRNRGKFGLQGKQGTGVLKGVNGPGLLQSCNWSEVLKFSQEGKVDALSEVQPGVLGGPSHLQPATSRSIENFTTWNFGPSPLHN